VAQLSTLGTLGHAVVHLEAVYRLVGFFFVWLVTVCQCVEPIGTLPQLAGGFTAQRSRAVGVFVADDVDLFIVVVFQYGGAAIGVQF